MAWTYDTTCRGAAGTDTDARSVTASNRTEAARVRTKQTRKLPAARKRKVIKSLPPRSNRSVKKGDMYIVRRLPSAAVL
jgi:hypothetical protein